MCAYWWSDAAHTHLLHRIVLLYMLNQIPEQPAKHHLQEAQDNLGTHSNRVLNLRHEKDLAEALVYLAASTDDPRKVVALYVEEGTDHESLYIRMAVNHGQLDRVEKTFSRLGSILESVAHGSEEPVRAMNTANISNQESTTKKLKMLSYRTVWG